MFVSNNLERRSLIGRFCASARILFGFLRAKAINLTLFRTSSFGNRIDRATAELLNRLATRLYICLLIIILIVLFLYTSIDQRTITKTINNPSLLDAQQLQTDYPYTAECPCTRISVRFDQFVDIESMFHQVRKEYGNVCTCFISLHKLKMIF